MVNVTQHDTKSFTTRVVLVLAIAAIVIAFVSVAVIASVTGNPYVAGYYTISSMFDAVGVDEISALSAVVPLYSPAFFAIIGLSVIDGIIKILIVGFVIAAVINLITSLDIRSRLALFAQKRIKNHVIICGYSLLAERVVSELIKKKMEFIVVDKDPARSEMMKELGYRVLHEDFTIDATLRNASIATADSVLFLTESDYENLLGVITARHLNKDVKIISRADENTSITKMHRAGAQLCIVPEVLAGMDMGSAVAGRGKA